MSGQQSIIVNNPPIKKYLTVTVWILRIVVGAVFIFAGWAKVDDIWGLVFKIEEYLAVWDLSLSRAIIVILAWLLATLEFTLGMAIISGCFRRVSAWLLTVFMSIMTLLTFWIYLKNPVSDCGCFGDAITISNGATFIKNLILLAFAVFLLFYNPRVKGLFVPHSQWTVPCFSGIYCIVIGVYGFNVQPLYDFRPYPSGKEINAYFDDYGDEPMMVYSKAGKEQAFPVDSLPDDDWTFVRRQQSENNLSNAFFPAIYDKDGEDVSENLLAYALDDADAKTIMLVVTEPRRHGISRMRMANNLYRYALANNINMFAIVATQNPDLWEKAVRAQYPVYTAEDTQLKQLARGEAALVFIDRGRIQWKMNINSFPPDWMDNDEITHEYFSTTKAEHPILHRMHQILLWSSVIYIILLVLSAGLPYMFTRKRNKEANYQKKVVPLQSDNQLSSNDNSMQ